MSSRLGLVVIAALSWSVSAFAQPKSLTEVMISAQATCGQPIQVRPLGAFSADSINVNLILEDEAGKKQRFAPSFSLQQLQVNADNQLFLIQDSKKIELGILKIPSEVAQACEKSPGSSINLLYFPVSLNPNLRGEMKIESRGCRRRPGVVPFLDPGYYSGEFKINLSLSDYQSALGLKTSVPVGYGYKTKSDCLAKLPAELP